MTLDSLKLLRNILYRAVLISIAFAIVLAALTFGLWDTWTGMAMGMFRTTETELSNIVIQFFTAIRFWIVFVLLTPALAIHWTMKKEEQKTGPAKTPPVQGTIIPQS